jgi:hypothetical protein
MSTDNKSTKSATAPDHLYPHWNDLHIALGQAARRAEEGEVTSLTYGGHVYSIRPYYKHASVGSVWTVSMARSSCAEFLSEVRKGRAWGEAQVLTRYGKRAAVVMYNKPVSEEVPEEVLEEAPETGTEETPEPGIAYDAQKISDVRVHVRQAQRSLVMADNPEQFIFPGDVEVAAVARASDAVRYARLAKARAKLQDALTGLEAYLGEAS